jgi:uncharacterized membrane protein
MVVQIFTAEGLLFLLRWIHFLSGVTWIGLLYYFNFVQVPFFAETEPPVRSGAIQKLVPRALLWFRMGAMMTFFSGWFIIGGRMSQMGLAGFFDASYGWAITTGGLLGSIMWANVWFVIWPNQKVVIANAVQTAAGGQPIPDAAARGRRAFLASRTNTLLSIPMLFFMGAASHLTLFASPTAGAKSAMAACLAIVLVLVEANSLLGTKGPLKKPLETIGGTILSGFVLAAVLYVLFEVIF